MNNFVIIDFQRVIEVKMVNEFVKEDGIEKQKIKF